MVMGSQNNKVTDNDQPLAAILAAATNLARRTESDVIFYNGGINRLAYTNFLKMCAGVAKRKNVIFFLCTNGGYPDVAYRIARFLQKSYTKFSICICGPCKSAGTLLAMGAQEIIMDDYGELGPLDIQLGKKDELWEMDSGLTVLEALDILQQKAVDIFHHSMIRLKVNSGGRVTLKTASKLAAELAVGFISPIVGQIDPMHLGEVSRAMNIARDYGRRLIGISQNADENTLNELTNFYPSHSFVIDKKEAMSKFKNVREPVEEKELIKLLDFMVREQLKKSEEDPFIMYLSQVLEGESNENVELDASKRPDSKEIRVGKIEKNDRGAKQEILQ